MNLLFPLALLGLLTLPVILLLHLLRNRREQITIPSLRLWRGLQRRRFGGLPRHIPLSLMLLLQLIVAIALTLALARPVFSFMLDRPQHTIFILDVSTSMTAFTNATQTRFEQARQTIQNQLQNLDSNDSVSLISLGSQPEILFSGNAGQRGSMELALNNLVPGGVGANLSQALSLTNGLVDPEQENRIVLLTDGNYTVEPERLPTVLALLDWQNIPAAEIGNQALLDISSRPLPDGAHRIFARVVNYDDTSVQRTLRLSADGQPADDVPLTILAQADAVQVWTVPASAQMVTVEIVEPDTLLLDNRAELLLINTSSSRVLLISDPPGALARAMQVQPGVELTTISPADLPDETLSDYDLLVFNGLPPELTAWPRGNVWVVNPMPGNPLLPAETTARNLRPDFETTGPLLDEVDLSGVYFGRAPRVTAPGWATIDLYAAAPPGESALPLIFSGTPRSGTQAMVWAFDLENSNLPARLALPLLTANTLSTLLTPSPPANVSPGQPVTLSGHYNIETPDGRRLFLTDDGNAASAFPHTRQPGLYKIYNENDELVAGFAVHAGSPQESNLTRQAAPEAIDAVVINPLPAPKAEIDFEEYWPLLAVLVVGIVIFEGWLAWRR